MQIFRTVREMQAWSLGRRAEGRRIALVPTMGALHEGHLALIDAAKKQADEVVLSIYVNPTQFGPQEDFDKYPRTFDRDSDLAEQRGVAAIFAPSNEEMYPAGHQTFVTVTELSRGLCGAFRPGHFRGVTTVVAKLFLIVQPQRAFFGEKDYQQLKVIQRMVADLNIPVEVIGVETVRDPDGLAMSSRNAYLSPEERAEALAISRSIALAQDLVKQGTHDCKNILDQVQGLLFQGKFTMVQYAEIVDEEMLAPLAAVERPARLILAVYINGKRLIDNGPLRP